MSKEKSRYTIEYFMDYGKNFGGAANTILQQAILTQQAGYRVVIFFSDYYGMEMESNYNKICSDLGIEWEWATYQLCSNPENIDIVCIDKNYEILKEKIVAYNPDILQSVQINACVELISRELKIPHIMNIYQLLPDFFTLKYINVFPHYHLCDSWYYAHKWERYLKTDSTCIRTAANKSKRSKVLPRQLQNYICVGSLCIRKNQLVVIKAFHKALLHGVEGTLTLYGNSKGIYADRCRQYIAENGLEKKILIVGFCAYMDEEYALSDVLICGSKVESYPNVISESMANGLIIISTPVGGVTEVIKDRENGYLTSDYSVEAIYEKILEIERDSKSGYIEKILINMESTFEKNHSPQSVTQQLIAYYEYVMEDYALRKRTERELKLPDIREVRRIFEELLCRFREYQEGFIEYEKVALKLWYIYHIESEIRSALNAGTEFYVWGTGKYGKIVGEILGVFFPQIIINGYLDSNKEGCFINCKIYKPNEILERKNIIIFIGAINGQNEMIEKLEAIEMNFNKDYFILAPRSW